MPDVAVDPHVLFPSVWNVNNCDKGANTDRAYFGTKTIEEQSAHFLILKCAPQCSAI